MDTIILAAGRNERLKGVVAPFHKPLLVVNGKSLVQHCLDIADRLSFGSVRLIVSPENALPISQVTQLAPNDMMIVQQKPLGPGHALHLGLKTLDPEISEEVMILCADNVFNLVQVEDMLEDADGNLKNTIHVGGRKIYIKKERERFTRVDQNKGRFIEGPLGDDEPLDCWIGPLVLPTHMAQNVFKEVCSELHDEEIKIANNLNLMGCAVQFHEMDCYDIGIKEALS